MKKLKVVLSVLLVASMFSGCTHIKPKQLKKIFDDLDFEEYDSDDDDRFEEDAYYCIDDRSDYVYVSANYSTYDDGYASFYVNSTDYPSANDASSSFSRYKKSFKKELKDDCDDSKVKGKYIIYYTEDDSYEFEGIYLSGGNVMNVHIYINEDLDVDDDWLEMINEFFDETGVVNPMTLCDDCEDLLE